MAVECVIELASSPENTLDSDYTSDCEDTPVVLCNVKLTAAVRKQLAVSIRDLMQHGLMPVSNSIVLNCVPNCTGIVLNCVLNCTGIVLNCVPNCTPVKLTGNVMSWTYITECKCSPLVHMTMTFMNPCIVIQL